MPMPKGKKFKNGYTTLKGRPSFKFRKIASVMSKRGTSMNHATARGVLMRGLEKIAEEVLVTVTGTSTPEGVTRLARDVSFQEYVGEVIDEDDILRTHTGPHE